MEIPERQSQGLFPDRRRNNERETTKAVPSYRTPKATPISATIFSMPYIDLQSALVVYSVDSPRTVNDPKIAGEFSILGSNYPGNGQSDNRHTNIVPTKSSFKPRLRWHEV
jgi:hypothetical protein